MNNVIKKLNNPKTPLYTKLKHIVLSGALSWFYKEETVDKSVIQYDDRYENCPMYGHTFLSRPTHLNNRISRENSTELPLITEVLLEILNHNNIEINYFLRMNANCVHPQQKIITTYPHVDHTFEHKNILIYLTNSGGETIVGDEYYDPNEDDVIIFGGQKHCHNTPEKNRRIVLVATFN